MVHKVRQSKTQNSWQKNCLRNPHGPQSAARSSLGERLRAKQVFMYSSLEIMYAIVADHTNYIIW